MHFILKWLAITAQSIVLGLVLYAVLLVVVSL